MKLVDVCQNCGSRDREVHHADEHDLWLCVPCYQRMPGGYFLSDEEMSPPPVTLRDLHPSSVFEPLPHRQLPSNAAAIAKLDDAERVEAEMWIRYGPDWKEHADRVVRPAGPVRRSRVMDIPSEVYAPTLARRELRFGRKMQCPFHADGEERTPSLQVYSEGWYCHACNRGGSIIDFAAALWGMEPRGRGFHEIRERLERELA